MPAMSPQLRLMDPDGARPTKPGRLRGHFFPALQYLVWVKPSVGLATRAAPARLVTALTEPFFCQFGHLTSEGNGERSTMLEGRRLFTHTEPGSAGKRMGTVSEPCQAVAPRRPSPAPPA